MGEPHEQQTGERPPCNMQRAPDAQYVSRYWQAVARCEHYVPTQAEVDRERGLMATWEESKFIDAICFATPCKTFIFANTYENCDCGKPITMIGNVIDNGMAVHLVPASKITELDRQVFIAGGYEETVVSDYVEAHRHHIDFLEQLIAFPDVVQGGVQ